VPASGVWSTVTVDETAAGVEAAARELVGRTVDDVRYYTLPYGLTDKPAWDEGVAHVAEYGLDLVTHSGTTGITWAPYGQFGYGLQLARGPVLTDLAPAGFCSVAGEPPWSAVLGERITAARVHWLAVTWGQEETTGPVALSLRIADSTGIVLACGSWRGPQEPLFPTGDDIVILWQPGTLPVLAPHLPGDLLGP
jgi:hypothetical protein